MIMPDRMREECFKTAVFMNKFENGKEKRKESLNNLYSDNPDNISTSYTYAAFCFLYGEKGDILDQKDAIVEAQRVFSIIAQKNSKEWLARYFMIRLDMLVSDDFRNDRDIDSEIDALIEDEDNLDNPCTQLTKLMKAESYFNLKYYDKSMDLLKDILANGEKVRILKDFFFNQVSSLYRKMVICQNDAFAKITLDIQNLLFD